MALLGDNEIEAKLAALQGWERRGDTIAKDFDRGDFVGSVAFVVPRPGHNTGTGVSSACSFEARITCSAMRFTSGSSSAAD